MEDYSCTTLTDFQELCSYLRTFVIGLCYSVCLAKLCLGLRNIGGFLLGQQDVASGALGIDSDRLLGCPDPSLRVALAPGCLH